jgi:hypothetical protein
MRFLPSRRVFKIGAGIFLLLVAGLLGTLYKTYVHEPYDPRPQPASKNTGLYKGVFYQRWVVQKPRPIVFHIVRIDMTTPGLRFITTPGRAGEKLPFPAQKTSQFLVDQGCQLAINGDFFYPCKINKLHDYYPHIGDPVTVEGDSISAGSVYATRDPHDWTTTLHISENNEITIGQALPGVPYNAIGGHQLHLEDIAKNPQGEKNPHTIVAYNRPKKELLLILVDGRQRGYSEGVTDREMAQFTKNMGATEAIMLDGGGSTTLAREEKGAPHGFQILNSPIDSHVPGRERAVANHLGIFIP